VSPTAPTFGTLNDRLTKAHRRIRELEARETELLAHNRALRAVIEELTNKDDSRTAAELVSLSNEAIDGSGISDPPGKHTSHGAGPVARSQASADTPVSASAHGTGTNRVKTRRFPYV
jgi:hypothetical protein